MLETDNRGIMGTGLPSVVDAADPGEWRMRVTMQLESGAAQQHSNTEGKPAAAASRREVEGPLGGRIRVLDGALERV